MVTAYKFILGRWLFCEFPSDAPYGDNYLWVGGVRLDKFSEFADVDVESFSSFAGRCAD